MIVFWYRDRYEGVIGDVENGICVANLSSRPRASTETATSRRQLASATSPLVDETRKTRQPAPNEGPSDCDPTEVEHRAITAS